jgi:alanyl-tRNA synthetase
MKEDISQIHIPFFNNINYDDLLFEAERKANEIVFNNISLSIIDIYPSEGVDHNIRKEPLEKYLDDSGKCRVVKIGDFESIPCGGTHCDSTSEVGLIKIIGRKKQNNKLVLDFVCGYRALNVYNKKLNIIDDICKILNTNEDSIGLLIRKNIDESDSIKKECNSINQELLSYKSKEIAQSYINIKDIKVISKDILGCAMSDIKFLSKDMVFDNNVISIIGNGKNFVISKSDNVSVSINDIFKKTCEKIPAIGGGKGNIIQGSIDNDTKLTDFFSLFIENIAGD